MVLFLVCLSVVGLYFIICYISSKTEKRLQDVNQLIENSIDLLKEHARHRPDESYLPVIHVRDHLIPFNQRQGMHIFIIKVYTICYCGYFILAKSKIWAEVVQYITESESSVRCELQEIDGEDYEVWRWIQPMSPGL